MCNWTFFVSPKFFGLKHRSIWNACNFGRSSSQCNHWTLSCSPMTPSHPTFFRQSSCSNSLAFIMKGEIKPSGSNNELTTDNTPRLVIGFSSSNRWILADTSQMNLSVSTFHFKPSAHAVGKSSMSKLTTELALSDCGISANTFRSLLSHFVNLKPPFASNSLSCEDSLIAISGEFTDFIKSSTYMFFFTVWTVTGSNSDW